MSERYKFTDPEGIYFITSTTVNWVDVFTRRMYKDMLIDSMRFCQANKGLRIHAYVIMSNHIHMVVSADDSRMLTNIFRDFKKFTSTQIIDLIRTDPQDSRRDWLLSMFGFEGRKHPDSRNNKLWQQGVHPKELDTPEKLNNALAYIHNNPVKEAWVHEPWEYVYSSATDYMTEQKGLLELELLI